MTNYSLERCYTYSNQVDVRISVPACEVWRNVRYVPIVDLIAWENGGGWGLFDEDNRGIEAANYYRGPGKKIVGQSLNTTISRKDLEVAPPGKYLYGGNLIAHYGHFLLSSLSRYWLSQYEDIRQFRIVCHGAGTPKGWLSSAHTRALFGALGLTEENFIVFKRPTILPEIIIPRPAAEEHNFTHRIYSDLGRSVGSLLLREQYIEKNDKPIWLSKAKLHSGTQGIANEEIVNDILSRNGVEIVYPEQLSIADQVRLFRTRSIIAGPVGSAFHTKILGSVGRCICINIYSTINSNYALTEEISENPIEFYNCQTIPTKSEDQRFFASQEFADPTSVARDLLDIINSKKI